MRTLFHQVKSKLCGIANYHIWRFCRQQVVSESEESHQMRYFFPQELALFLGQTQLGLLDIHPFGNMDCAPGDDTWNILVIGKSL